MALAHFSAQFIPATRSPIAAAAYRHRTTMYDASTGETYSYTRPDDLVHSELVIPDNSPKWMRNLISHVAVANQSQALWNEVLAQENQTNGQSAREIVIALPRELTVAQNIDLMRDFVAQEYLAKGLVADWVYHDKPGNPHVHIMHTLRAIEPLKFGRKRIPLRDVAGALIIHNDKRVYRPVIGTRAEFNASRMNWGATATRHLHAAGFDQTVDMSSYHSRGIDLKPTSHRGPTVNALVIKQRPSINADLLALDTNIAAAQILAKPSLILSILTNQSSTFGQRDIARIAHRFSNDTATFEAIVCAVMTAPELATLRPDITDQTTGKIVATAVYSTTALVEIERQMAATADRLLVSSRAAVPANLISEVVTSAQQSAGFTFSGEQIAAIRHVTGGGDIASVIGVAGTGKSTMLAVANAAWQADGRRVVGGALAGKAADALQGSSGIPSRTLASWQLAWSNGRDQLGPGDVFVLDEAGMVASSQLASFINAAAAAGAKIVLVGDPEQLQPIEAGAAFRAITERTGFASLTDVRRQTVDWQRRATLDLASGAAGAALACYRSAGHIETPATRDAAIDAIVAAYTARQAADPTASLMVLAHSNASVYALNQAIRAAIADRLGGGTTFTTDTGSRTFARDDRLMFLENKTFVFDGAPELGQQRVKNGSLATILSTDHGVIRAQLDTGPLVVFDQATYTNLDHGYAATIHKNQGATVDHAFVLAAPTMDRHLAYVALSRHRSSVRMYAPRDDFKTQSLDECLTRAAVKSTTLDFETEFTDRRGFHSLGRLLQTTRAVLAVQRGRLLAVSQRFLALAPRASHAKPFVGLASQVWSAHSAVDTINVQLTGHPIWQRRSAVVQPILASLFRDPTAAQLAMTAAVFAAGDPSQLRQTPLAVYGDLIGKPSSEASATIAAYLRASIRDAVAQRPALLAAHTAQRQRQLIAIPAPGFELSALLAAMHQTRKPPAIAAELLARSIPAHVVTEIAQINQAISERFGDKLLWSRPTVPVTAQLCDGLSVADSATLCAAIPSLLAIRQLTRFVPRTTATTPDNPVPETAIPPKGSIPMDAQATDKLVYDQAAGTIKYPYNPDANRAMVDVATWNKEAKVYVVNDGTTQQTIDKAISQAERALEKTAQLAVRGAALADAIKAAQPELRPQAKDNRVSFSIPPRMEAATIAAKQMGAVYAATKTDKTRWSIDLTNVSDERVMRGAQNVGNEIQQAQRSTSIAGAIAAAGHTDERISLSNAADTLYVRSPNLPSANNELKAVGFKWDDDAGAYALKIDATVDPKAITGRLTAVSAAYDNALVPPTAERGGIDHPPWRVADALKLPADELRSVLDADPKLAKSAQIYATQVEKTVPGLRDELKSGQYDSVAVKLGIPSDLAASITSMHKALDTALAPAPSPVRAQAQAQSM